MFDVACALHNLYHECKQSINDCDLKESNVLLDGDTAKIVPTTSQENSRSGRKGTLNYAPPGLF